MFLRYAAPKTLVTAANIASEFTETHVFVPGDLKYSEFILEELGTKLR